MVYENGPPPTMATWHNSYANTFLIATIPFPLLCKWRQRPLKITLVSMRIGVGNISISKYLYELAGKFMVGFNSWILYHCFHLVNFLFSYWISTRLKKIPSVKLFFFRKSSHFCAITSILWQICLQTGLIYDFRFLSWNKTHDDCHSSKTTDEEFYCRLVMCPKLKIQVNTWYVHDFLEAVDNNIRTFFPLNAAIISCFW